MKSHNLMLHFRQLFPVIEIIESATIVVILVITLAGFPMIETFESATVVVVLVATLVGFSMIETFVSPTFVSLLPIVA